MLFRIKDPVKGVLCVQVDPGWLEDRDAFDIDVKAAPSETIVRHLQNRLGDGPFVTNKGVLRHRVEYWDAAFLFRWKCWPVPAGR